MEGGEMDSANPGDNPTSMDRDRPSDEADYWRSVQAAQVESAQIESQERPFGVSLVVTFIVLGVLLSAFFALNAWIRAEELEEAPLLAIAFIAQALLGIVVAWGLWGLREWARMLAVILYTLSFALSFFANFNEPLTAGSLAGLLIPLAIAIYLIQPNVKDKFI
jgi:uncharacterized membrane protein (DUF2068 family)